MLLKKGLLKDEALFEKYKATMTEVKDRPVTHPLKSDKLRVVYDCAVKYGGTSFNQPLLQGPDQTNQLVGV